MRTHDDPPVTVVLRCLATSVLHGTAPTLTDRRGSSPDRSRPTRGRDRGADIRLTGPGPSCRPSPAGPRARRSSGDGHSRCHSAGRCRDGAVGDHGRARRGASRRLPGNRPPAADRRPPQVPLGRDGRRRPRGESGSPCPPHTRHNEAWRRAQGDPSSRVAGAGRTHIRRRTGSGTCFRIHPTVRPRGRRSQDRGTTCATAWHGGTVPRAHCRSKPPSGRPLAT